MLIDMDKKLVIFYLKRHALGIAGLVLAVGFIVGGVMVSGKAKVGLEASDGGLGDVNARRDKIQNSPVKVDMRNVAILNEDADSYQKFVNQAGAVLKPLEVLPPMGGEEFGLHLLRTIGLLNQKAKDSFVSVPTTLTNRMDIPYGFTFGLLMNKTGISEDKVQEMQIQLEDIKMLSSVLFDSRVQKIIAFKRNRVTIEDKKNPQDPRYLDERLKYTNNISVVRPYRVKFQCMSDGIASTLSRFASQKAFVSVRRMEVTPPGATSGQDGNSGMGNGEMYGGEMDGSSMANDGGEVGSGSVGMQQPGGVMSTNAMQQFVTQLTTNLVSLRLTAPPAKNILGEAVLEVVMDIDVVRRAASVDVENDD
jgi:hypothetical protein